MDTRLQISVIIVNYNAYGYILLALESVYQAIKGFKAEVIIIDNASTDESVDSIRRFYPETIIIQNSRNIGFAAANNMGIRQAKGEFVLLVNPDTVLPEDAFGILIEFMYKTPDAGAVGCKILNADGSFSVDSRHSVPSPVTAFWKQLGLNRLFPKSKIFGQYNLTYLDPDETYAVDAISGSFMFLRRQGIEQIGLLDEDYFMYCEDLDYCYRFNQAGWKVYYYPKTAILHYKGESTNKNTIRYNWNFSQSLYLFYRKHFQHQYRFLMHGIVLLGIILRAVLVCIKHGVRNIFVRIRHGSGKSKVKEKKVIWAGSATSLEKSREMLTSSGYRIIGIISSGPASDKNTATNIPVLGSLQSITEFISPTDADEIIYSAEHLSYKTIIKSISDLYKWKMNNKILPAKINLLIGKSST